MQALKILILAGLWSIQIAGGALAQTQPGDEAIVAMSEAAKRGDAARLRALLPQVSGHPLEPWAIYWDLKARLAQASATEVQSAFNRLSGSYQEDRLRNDWLALLGQRRDWDNFSREYAKFRMHDDREIRCYALYIERGRGGASAESLAQELLRNWYAIRDADDGCAFTAASLHQDKLISAADIWKKARLSLEANRPRAAANAVAIVAPSAVDAFNDIIANPARYLRSHALALTSSAKELIALALIRWAASDADAAAQAMEGKWAAHLSAEQRSWVWAVLGKEANLKLAPEASLYFAKAANEYLSDDLLGWKVRAALRASRPEHGWPMILDAINAMTETSKREPIWAYWKARALREIARAQTTPVSATPSAAPPSTSATLEPKSRLQEAQDLLESIASARGFYEILASEELGRKLVFGPAPTPLTAAERQAARLHPGLNRALYAIALGLRPDGVREWNYSTNLHTRGGMSERELLAAADFACQRQVWDRCINSSERTKEVFDLEQRYPTPFRDALIKHSRAAGLDPALVFGLIRQESRFITSARSHVGASGLMQVMPATARWTARKIGIDSLSDTQLTERDNNLAIGTAYLKLLLDEFQGSVPLATAAYNAGPGRPRAWRAGLILEGAAWAENIPFNETRDYVKKVAANTIIYASVLGAQPSLRQLMGSIGPRSDNAPPANPTLP